LVVVAKYQKNSGARSAQPKSVLGTGLAAACYAPEHCENALAMYNLSSQSLASLRAVTSSQRGPSVIHSPKMEQDKQLKNIKHVTPTCLILNQRHHDKILDLDTW